MAPKFYVRIAEGLDDSGFLYPKDDFEKSLQEGFASENDQYSSVYLYNEDHYKQFQTTKSVRGIKNVVTDRIIFDFDSDSDPELARKDTLELVNRLKAKSIDPDNIDLYWSGKKGFTVNVKLDRTITPEVHEKVALDVFGKGLQTLDRGVYNASRILRVPNTKHPKSHLYKVKLTYSQLQTLDVDKIKKLAAKPTDKIKLSNPIKLQDDVFQLPPPVKKEKPKLSSTNTVSMLTPRHWKDYKWAILNAEGLKAGERHYAMMVIAATCRGLGYNQELTESFLRTFDAKYSEVTKQGENEEEISLTLSSVFSENWNGGQYSIEKNAWLRSYCERMGFNAKEESKVIQLHDIEEEFIDYVKNIDKNTILTGIQELDEAVPLTVGMNLGLVGAASSGKTALALKILKNTSDAGVISVFASLDMRRNRIFEKLLYRVSGLSRQDLYKAIQTDSSLSKKIFSDVKEQYKNVFFYDRSCPTVEDIRDYIKQVELATGQKVKLVMLDYFERVNADKSDDTAASKEVAGKLQDLVNDLNVCLITLVQPNKFSLSAGPDSPILNYTAIKGSGFMYQSFRSIISIWRPFFTPETKDDDKFLEMAVLKNDLGELGKFQFGWSGKRGEIWSLTDEEKNIMNDMIQEKNRRKNQEETNNGWN